MNEEILLALGRLEGKVDALMTTMRAQEQELKILEKRIRELEQHKFMILGAAGVISMIAGFVVKLLP